MIPGNRTTASASSSNSWMRKSEFIRPAFVSIDTCHLKSSIPHRTYCIRPDENYVAHQASGLKLSNWETYHVTVWVHCLIEEVSLLQFVLEVVTIATYHHVRNDPIIFWLEVLQHTVFDTSDVIRLPSGFILGVAYSGIVYNWSTR